MLPAEGGPQGGLHGAGIFEQLSQRVGRDIGGDRQRCKERPFENAAPGKAIALNEPGGTAADHSGSNGHQDHQQKRIAEILRKGGGQQMRPEIFGGRQSNPEDRNQRRN